MISVYQLNDFLVSQGIKDAAVHMADGVYACPSAAWIVDVYGPAWMKLLARLDLTNWEAEEFDCDDFAELCDTWASILHRKTPDHPQDSALAFGQFWYLDATMGGGHAINVAAVAGTNNKASLLFFEPQTGKPVTLTPEEIASCDYVVF